MKWSQVAGDVRQASGLTPDGIASSNRSGPSLDPGKTTLVQSALPNRTQHGACTQLGPGAPGCYLDDDARRDYVVELGERVGHALTNFKLAVHSIRTRELLEKEDELHWLTGLIIDVASTFLGSAIGKALKKVRMLGAETMFERSMKHAGEADAHMFQRADALLRGVSDSRIDSWTKAAFDPIKKRGQVIARGAQNADSRRSASDVQMFLQGLSAAADDAYGAFLQQLKVEATDSEIAVALEGMRRENHYERHYEDALSAKLERYKKSRVRDIGRKLAKDDNRVTTVARETRVVWVVHGNLPGKRLHYQYQQGGVHSLKPGGDDPGKDYAPPWIMDMLPPWFGVGGDATIGAPFGMGRGDIKIGAPVPEEFVELALARSEALYGVTTVVDPWSDYMRSQGIDPDPRWKPKPILDSKPSPAPAPKGAPVKQPAPFPAMPSDSVFAGAPGDSSATAGSGTPE